MATVTRTPGPVSGRAGVTQRRVKDASDSTVSEAGVTPRRVKDASDSTISEAGVTWRR